MKVFAYRRLSKYEDTSTSIARQEVETTALIEVRGWTLVDTFTDEDNSGWSKDSRDPKRPEFDEMMSRLREVDAVVFMRLDRLARTVVGYHKTKQRCADAGVQLVSADLVIDTTTPVGTAMETIVAAFAQLESDTLSLRATQAAAYRRSQGLHNGQVPFGWERGADRRLVPVPEQQATLVEIATRYVAGESMRSIAPTVGWTHPNLAHVLRSDRVLEALPTDLAPRLAVEMAERGRTGGNATMSLLGGIARCGVCGEGMTVVGSRAKTDATCWSAYSCRTKAHASISRPWLDSHVSGLVLDEVDVPELLKRMAKRRAKPSAKMAVPALEARLERLDEDHHVLGSMPRSRYLAMRSKLIDQLAVAHKAQEASDGPDLPAELAEHLTERWPSFTVRNRRRVVAAVVESVVVQKAKSVGGKIDPSRVEVIFRG